MAFSSPQSAPRHPLPQIRHRSAALRALSLAHLLIAGCLWLALGPSSALGQTAQWGRQAPQRFENLGPEHGLPHRRVFAVVQDQHGFLWIGTQNGLARFDGYRLKTFEHSPNDQNSLSDNYVTSLAIDPSGSLWVGTKSGELNLFAPRQETFRRVQHLPPGAEEARLQSIDKIVVTDDGGLWLKTSSELYHRRSPGDAFRAVSLPSDGSISPVTGSEDGAIWYASAQDIFRISPQHLQFEKIFTFPAPFGNTSLLDDGQGKLWLASAKHLGKYQLDTADWIPDVVDFDELDGVAIDGSNLPMFLDRRGTLWFSSHGLGLLAYDTAEQQLRQFTHRDAHSDSLASDYVLTILEDRSGILWAGTVDGLSKLDPTRQSGLLLQHDPNDPSSLSPGEVLTTHRGPSGRLFVGYFGTGIDELDASGRVIRRLTTSTPSPSKLSSGVVWALLEDAEHQLWIGTEVGLERYDLDTGRLRRIPNSDPEIEIDQYRVVTLETDVAGNLWVGTGNGISRLDKDRQQLISYPYMLQGEPSTHVLALLGDPQGNLWIGTDGNGLYRLDPETLDVERFHHHRDDPRSLPHGIISDLHEDDGILWITTLGGGLVRHRIGSREFDSPVSSNEFLSSSIASLLPASDGTFWLPTDRGLNKYHPEHQILEAWDTSDGLPRRGFTSKAGFADPAGTLFLGSSQGLYIFDPEAQVVDTTSPTPVITGLSILNRRISPRRLDASSPLSVSITETTSLTLSHRQYLFSLEFSGLHFANPTRNQYRYRLEGVDPDWVKADSGQRSAQYAHLSPGSYTFEVYASNRDGIESAQPARLEIIVLPPPWRTWWAYTLYSLALLAIIIAFVRAQQRKVQQQLEINRQLDELVTARTKQVQILNGLLPICAGCKKIRDDAGYWNEVESFVEERTDAVFSHSMCPPCATRLYPDIDFSRHDGSRPRL